MKNFLLSYDSSKFSSFEFAEKHNGLTFSKCDYSEILKSIKSWSVASQIFYDVVCSSSNTIYGFMTVHSYTMTIQEIDHAIDELGYKTPYDVLNAEILNKREGYTTSVNQHHDGGWWWCIHGNDDSVIAEGCCNSYQLCISRVNAILAVV